MHEKGADTIRDLVEADFAENRDAGLTLPQAEIDRIISYFALPDLPAHPARSATYEARQESDPAFALFAKHNVFPHKIPGHGIVTISLKPVGGIPGDASDRQMDHMADLAAHYSHDELRVSHEQNIVLPHVALDDIPAIYDGLVAHGLATSNIGLVSDIICCPGLDYCALATARSIPVAQQISERFGSPERAAEIGNLKIKISGCINACGHHHVGHIGILGLEKAGVESYQLTLGGAADEACAIGDITGRGFSSEKIVDAVETVVDTYLRLRTDTDEDFLSAYRRVGMKPFKEALYAGA